VDDCRDDPAFGHDSGVVNAPAPDWYFDDVLVDAEPGGPERTERGVAHLWRRWWQRQWDDAGADPAARAARAQGFVLTRDEARRHGLSEADIRRRGGSG